MILYYPMSALLTLFYSVLHRPLDPQSPKDIELCRSMLTTIRKLPMRRLARNEAMHIQLIDELVEELTRLGWCAIEKAQRESREGMEV